MRIFGDPYGWLAGNGIFGAGGDVPLRYLLDDEFLTNAAAPLTSPRNAEPGPGQLTLTQAATGQWLVAAGELATNGSSSTTLPTAYINGITRAAGLAFRIRALQNSAFGVDANKTISPSVGWSNVAAGVSLTQLNGILFWSIVGQWGISENDNATIFSIDPCLANTYYDLCFVARSTGNFTLIQTGGIWKLLFPHATNNFTPLFPIIGQTSANRYPPKSDYFRVAQIGAPWTDDYGLATQRLAGARSVSDAFVHEAGAQWLEFTLTTLPSAGNVTIDFRKQDANNYWQLNVSSAGVFALVEVVAGVPTTRTSTTGCVSGDRLLCVMDGANARLYRMRATANANSTVYAAVATFTTQTAGVISSLGTGGAISDLIAWPRNLSGSAAAWLNAL